MIIHYVLLFSIVTLCCIIILHKYTICGLIGGLIRRGKLKRERERGRLNREITVYTNDITSPFEDWNYLKHALRVFSRSNFEN